MLIRRAIDPSMPSTNNASANHRNIVRQSLSAAAIRARNPHNTPLAVKKCTPSASHLRCGLTGGFSKEEGNAISFFIMGLSSYRYTASALEHFAGRWGLLAQKA
jgi:hypothetical protein